MDSNFLEQFERVRGLMFAASGFLGFWSGVMLPFPTDVMVVFVSNAVFLQFAYF